MRSVSTILNPIHEELVKVENCLESVNKVHDDGLEELLNHSLVRGGKRIRPALTLLASKIYNYNPIYLIPMAASVELLHTATLVHDDVIDKSSVRHGHPTVNNIWGEKKAVILGDYLFSRAAELCTTTDNLRAVKLFAQTMATMSAGELNQAFNAFNLKQTREQYLDRINKKTASLFILAAESGAILSHAPEESVKILKDYGYNLGMAFQIVDDILDFVGTEEQLGKPVGSDLAQGTLTLPALLILERYCEDNPIQKYFENRGDPEMKERVIELVRNSMVIQECYDIAANYCTKACQNINLLSDSPSSSILMDLACYVVERKK